MRLYDEKIHKFLDDCYAAGIKDPVRFLTDKMPRVYGWLRGAFPRGILPTDIDGEVEIEGYFLRLEFKYESALLEGRIPRGQMRCFEKLLETERFTVLIVGHDQRGEVSCAQLLTRTAAARLYNPCDAEKVFKICQRWAESVEKKRKYA